MIFSFHRPELKQAAEKSTWICHLSYRHSFPPRHVTQDGEYSKSWKEAGGTVSCGDNQSVPEIKNKKQKQV